MDDILGVVNIYKEKGFTSHDVVNIVRKYMGRIKTGHTGTLDPDAEGVLPVCVGKATKLADYITDGIKEYTAELTLGVTTSTEDSTGEVLEVKPVECTREEAEKAILSFVGEYSQLPPMYSAVKINGKKLYQLAREGKEAERKPRTVHIYGITQIKFMEDNKAVFNVLCSKGTYIRTLCSDIGKKLGCGGHMSALTRIRSGNFYIKDSIKIEEFKERISKGDYSVVTPVETILTDCKKVNVVSAGEKYLHNGNPISLNYLKDRHISKGQRILLCDVGGSIWGLYEAGEDMAKPVVMLNSFNEKAKVK